MTQRGGAGNTAKVSPAGAVLAVAACMALYACPPADREGPERATVRLLVPASERDVWRPIVESFAASHHGSRVDLVEGPNSTDLRESLVSTSLLAGDRSHDLVYLDVTWTAKFAQAGWLRDLSSEFDEETRGRFLAPAIQAGLHDGRLYRVPVRTDVGCLFYRKDLLDEAGIPPPETFEELASAARRLQDPPERWGFVWQGKQYEGLVCNFIEVLAGFGGFWLDPATGEVGLDSPAAAGALRFLVDCLSPGGISPPGVSSYEEEESRHLFQAGRAVFLRSWPYAWQLAQRADSPIRGKVGVRAMVSAPAGRPGATLGGWGLGVAASTRHPEAALAFVRYATSIESQRSLCIPTGFAPARRETYEMADLVEANPFLPAILALHESAVARPALASYARASDILVRRLSAALSGRETVEEALAGAARETRDLLSRGGRRARAAGARH